MAGSESAALICSQFEEVFSVTRESQFLNSVRFSQALDKLLALLPTDSDHAQAASLLACSKLASFIVSASQGIDASHILKAPRTRLLTNFLKSLEMIRKVACHSFDVCRELSDQGLPTVLLSQLDILGSYSSQCKEESVCRLARSMLDTLFEIYRRVPAARASYRSADGVRIFLALTSYPNDPVRLHATLLLSHIIDEKENDYINATERHLRLILNAFPSSVGQRRIDILRCLKILASHDRNTEFFATNHFVLRLEEFAEKQTSSWSVEEETAVYEILWLLTFNQTCRQEIGECSCLIQAVTAAVEKGRSPAVQCNANGLLWKMKEAGPLPSNAPKSNQLVTDGTEDEDDDDEEEEQDEDETSSGDGDDDDVVDVVVDVPCDPLPSTSDSGLVLLVYTPCAQGVFSKLLFNIKKAGYNNALSRCSLRDASIQSMARAVKQAVAIIFEVSAASKCCAWLREVLEMSHRLRKTLVPLLLESNYNADGWLGFICGSNLVYDMYDDKCMEPSMRKVFLELEHCGKKDIKQAKPSSESSKPVAPFSHSAFDVRHHSMTENTKDSAPVFDYSLQLHEQRKIPEEQLKVTVWTKEQVELWLHELGIPEMAVKRLSGGGLDGSLLLTWYRLLAEAPNVFYQSAQQELSLGLTDTLRLSKGLRSLVGEFGKPVLDNCEVEQTSFNKNL